VTVEERNIAQEVRLTILVELVRCQRADPEISAVLKDAQSAYDWVMGRKGDGSGVEA
jgi:hypothetical protein